MLFCDGSVAKRLQSTLKEKFDEHEDQRLLQIADSAQTADPLHRVSLMPRRPSLPPPPGSALSELFPYTPAMPCPELT